MKRISAITVVLALVIFGLSSGAFAKVYKWADEKGEMHITDYPGPGSGEETKKTEEAKEAPRTVSIPEPMAQEAVVNLNKETFSPQESIELEYHGLPGNQQDWITIVKSSAPDNTYGQWFYTKGNTDGTYTFDGLPAGDYQVRVYFDWPNGSYNVQLRKSFTVQLPGVAAAPSKPAPEQQAKPAPSKPAPSQAEPAKPTFPSPSEPMFPEPGEMPEGMPEALTGILALLAGFIMIFAIIGIAGYVFFSLCLFLIAKKLDVPAAWTAWIPMVQVWAFVSAAGKPWWWILLLLIPVVQIFIGLYLWMCITENLGKNKWVGLLMFFPGAVFLLPPLIWMAVLAFSKGPEKYIPMGGEFGDSGMGFTGPEPPGAEFIDDMPMPEDEPAPYEDEPETGEPYGEAPPPADEFPDMDDIPPFEEPPPDDEPEITR